jgi:hypothetical protein
LGWGRTLVQQEVLITRFQKALDYGLHAVRLFVAGQAALAEARHFHVQKADEVARVRVGRDERRVVF